MARPLQRLLHQLLECAKLTTGSTGSLFISHYSLTDLASDHFLTNGTIRYNGAISDTAFQASESDGGVYINITAIPEPSSCLFLLTVIAAALLQRHRLLPDRCLATASSNPAKRI